VYVLDNKVVEIGCKKETSERERETERGRKRAKSDSLPRLTKRMKIV